MADLTIRCKRCGLEVEHACGTGLREAARRFLFTLWGSAEVLGEEEYRRLEIAADNLMRAAGVKPGSLREELEAELGPGDPDGGEEPGPEGKEA